MSTKIETMELDGGKDQTTLRTWIGVLGMMLGGFMAVVDIQITNSSLRDITGGIGATLDEGS
jgi:MFS transporter, DHA2 family, multidrug resistance protein